jgi:hypothetical protein
MNIDIIHIVSVEIVAMKSFNPLLKHLITAVAFVGVSALTAEAQQLKTLGTFQPTLLPSESFAQGIYSLMPTSSFKASSGCFQRAHHWAFQLSARNNIKSMKVFLFFTERYKREFDYEWMYHVAPLMPVQKADGSTEELVFDPTFINTPSWATGEEAKNYDNKPISISAWIKYFISPEVECPVIENYQDYFNYQERYYCYIMKTPMFTYIPANIETETEVRNSWRSGDLEQMKKALKLENRL